MPEFDTIAAIDLGSNSFHLQIVRVVDGQIYELDSIKETIRLAYGLGDDKRLSDSMQDAALACMGRFAERLRGFAPGSVRAVGTNTVRIARNAKSFLNKAEKALGFPIEVIAGREEARLVYLGVAHSLPISKDNRLVIDIGGGSTECILGNGLEPIHTESLYMGCVSYTQRFFPDGKISSARMNKAELAARSELQTITSEFDATGWREAYASSGTARTLGAMIEQNGFGERAITPYGLAQLRSAFIEAGDARRIALQGLPSDRTPVIAAGLAIMSAAVAELQIGQMELSTYALRHGVLFDLIGRAHHQDMRETTVEQFMQRYHVDSAQAKRVEQAVRRLYEPLRAALPRAQRESALQRLTWAARLHEIGISIAYSGYHKHSSYIVQNADMPGFSKADQSDLALLALAHRGSLNKLRSLVTNEHDWALILVLRVAVLLNRRRASRKAPPAELRVTGIGLELTISPEWLQNHPLTATALENEVEQWTAIGRSFRVV